MDIQISANVISIPELEFVGNFSNSDNKVFTIAWSQTGYYSYEKWHTNKYNLLIFYNDNIILKRRFFTFEVQLSTFNNGKICDEGTSFIFESYLGDEPLTYFYLFNKTGAIWIRYLIHANIYSAEISNDGHYAVFHTCNSDNDDGNKLFFFDLRKRMSLWKNEIDSGWPDDYEFDFQKKIIFLVYKDHTKYAVGFNGAFLDKRKYEENFIKKADGVQLYFFSKNKIDMLKNNFTYNDVEEIISLLNEAIKRKIDVPEIKAKIYREIGEIYEKLGDLGKTIKHFEKALAINPKVGVKLRLKELKKTS